MQLPTGYSPVAVDLCEYLVGLRRDLCRSAFARFALPHEWPTSLGDED